jgi:hypothetical protein
MDSIENDASNNSSSQRERLYQTLPSNDRENYQTDQVRSGKLLLALENTVIFGFRSRRDSWPYILFFVTLRVLKWDFLFDEGRNLLLVTPLPGLTRVGTYSFTGPSLHTHTHLTPTDSQTVVWRHGLRSKWRVQQFLYFCVYLLSRERVHQAVA